MKKLGTFLLLFFFGLTQSNAQNQTLTKKKKIEEFGTYFIQNTEFRKGSLTKYKNINFSIEACLIKVETIDYENSMGKNIVIVMPTFGARINKKGEIYYETKAIKEVLENKISKQIVTHFYSNSKKIGLFLKLEKEQKHEEMQERIEELSGFCESEKK